jgi:hypothetical protein
MARPHIIDSTAVSRRVAIATLAAAGAGLACRATPERPASRLQGDDIVEEYVRLTLQLAQHQPSLVEDWLGPASWRPGPRRPVADIATKVDELRDAAGRLAIDGEPGERSRYLHQQIEGLHVAARRLLGESMRFDDEARAAFGSAAGELTAQLVNDAPPPSSPAGVARADLGRRLGGRGPLHERHTAFVVQHAIAPGRLLPTLIAATQLCRERVQAQIPLPGDESVTLDTTTGTGLQGRATYEGGYATRVLIAASSPIDLARLVWLVAHETYPGHHVQHVLADHELVRGRGWHERALHPSFGAHHLHAEGAAEAGAALLLDGEAFEDICRDLAQLAGTPRGAVSEVVAVHRAVTELDALVVGVARQYLDGELATEDAAEQLAARALVGSPHQFLFTIERQRTRLLAYPVGRRLVMAHVFDAPAAQRWARLAQIATTLTMPPP